MPSSIGLRVYQATLHAVRGPKNEPFNSAGLHISPPNFLIRFGDRFPTSNQDEDLERSWHFEPRDVKKSFSQGYIRYGTFGFESDFVDTKTQEKTYRRETDHIEIIPLFYKIWHPAGADYILLAFQSFQGKSCINLVTSKMGELFASENPGFILKFKKLLPEGSGSSIYANSAVKRLRLIRKNAPSDIADSYLGGLETENVDFEIIISAKRKDILGRLGILAGNLSAKRGGLVSHDGVAFEEAVAEIKVGGKIRRVGVFGPSGDAGVIDLSDSVKRGLDGHPTFASISRETDELLRDFQLTLSGGRS